MQMHPSGDLFVHVLLKMQNIHTLGSFLYQFRAL